MLLFLLMRLTGLGNDLVNSDAARWHRRSEKFLTALKTGDFISTYQHYQPGVTLMWLNAATKQAAFWYQLTYTKSPGTLENANWFPIIHGASKAVIVLMLAALLLVHTFAIAKLYSSRTALIFAFLMSAEPYLIGIDRWFHLTSLETYLGFAAFLLVLLWQKHNKNIYLIWSSLLALLAVYTKLTSLIVLPLLVFIVVRRCAQLKLFRPLLLFITVFGVAIFVLFPAMVVNPIFVLTKFYGAITSAVSEDVRGSYFTGPFSHFYYLIILLFRLSPLTIAFLLGSLLQIKSLLKTNYVSHILILLATFFIVLTVSDQKIDRYAVAFIPCLLLIAAVGMSALSNKTVWMSVTAVLLFVAWLAINFYPVYSAFYSPILGGTKAAITLGIYENGGAYFANAARYLNTKGRDNYVFVPNNTDAFSLYYKGKTQSEFNDQSKFLVTSLDFDRKSPQNQYCNIPDAEFGPHDAKVVYVFRCK